MSALLSGWARTFSADSVAGALLAAAIVTALMSVAHAGVPLAMVIVIVIAVGYGELIRRNGLFGAVREEESGHTARTPWVQGLAAVVLGLSLYAPYLLSPMGIGASARITGAGWLLVLAGVVGVPLTMMMLFGRDRSGQLGAGRAIQAAWKHPFATCAAIAVVPLAAVFLEGILFFLAWHFDTLGYLLGDLFPSSEAGARVFKMPSFSLYAPGASSEPMVIQLYWNQLGQGYSLLGSIPPSLSLRMARAISYSSLGQPETQYFYFRIVATFLSATVMILSLALQARWLGLITSLEASSKPATGQNDQRELILLDLRPPVPS